MKNTFLAVSVFVIQFSASAQVVSNIQSSIITGNTTVKASNGETVVPVTITHSNEKDKETFQVIKPNQLIKTTEYEILLEEKKKKETIKENDNN